MGRKRRQRSTAIRKRIEKKRREEKKQKAREAKRAGKDRDLMMETFLPREDAGVCATGLEALGQRLDAGPIRGWTTADLQGDPVGLGWLGTTLATIVEEQDTSQVRLELSVAAQGLLLDKLSALEMAAPGLKLEWEEGFPTLARALSHAEEIPIEEDEEEEESEG